MAGACASPRVMSKGKAISSGDFGEVGNTQIEVDAIAPMVIGFRHLREGSNDLHNADISNTIQGREHFVKGRDVEGAVDFLEKGAKDRKEVVVTERNKRMGILEKLVTAARVQVPPREGNED
jgi:hypothetical protein